MSRGRIELLQWFGLLAGPLAWATQLVLGYFFTEAHCEVSRWGAGWSPSEIAVTATAALVAAGAEIAAVSVFRELRRISHDAPGPPGRQHFLAAGAMVGDVLFLIVILMSGITVVSIDGCRQA